MRRFFPSISFFRGITPRNFKQQAIALSLVKEHSHLETCAQLGAFYCIMQGSFQRLQMYNDQCGHFLPQKWTDSPPNCGNFSPRCGKFLSAATFQELHEFYCKIGPHIHTPYHPSPNLVDFLALSVPFYAFGA